MARETLAIAALQSGILFLFVWLVFRLVPSLSPNAKAWIWRLAFLKPLFAIVPFAVVTLYILPAPQESKATVVTSNLSKNTTNTKPSATVLASPASSVDPLLSIWVVGVILVAGYGVTGALKVSKIIRSAELIDDEEIQVELQRLLARANLKQTVRLLSSEAIETPVVASGFTPSIVIPTRALHTESLGDIRMMMAHEVAHIARRDLLWFGLAWIVQSLFFFNPVVWVAARNARLDHESATDRHALALAGVPTQTYAEMLLRATVVARTSIAPGVLPMSESFRTIHRRLEAMKHFQSKPSGWRTIGVGALALLVGTLIPSYNFAQSKEKTKTELVEPKVTKSERQITKTAESKQLLAPTVAKLPATPTKPTSTQRIIHAAKGNPKVVAPLKGSAQIAPTSPAKTSAKTADPTAASDPVLLHPAPFKASVSSDISPVAPVENASKSAISAVAVDPTELTSAAASITGASTIDIEMQEGDIRQAINLLFMQAKLSYIMEEGVQGKITLSLKSVPFDVCLKTLLDAVGASYQMDGPIYKIQAKKPI